MVVDGEARRRDISEAILARLRFAVAPVESAERAVAIMADLAPEIIVAGEVDARKIRDLAPARDLVPILAVDPATRETEALIDAVRRTLRTRMAQA
jgi:hypothetical protein